jgi:hypothetical protein
LQKYFSVHLKDEYVYLPAALFGAGCIIGNNCCDVIFETDVTAIKVLTAMCGDILHQNQVMSSEHMHLPKASVVRCRDEVLSACGLDITAVIKDQTGLTKDYRQILDEIRSFNNSACLKHNFGVQLSMIGTPRRMRYFPERYFRDKTITASKGASGFGCIERDVCLSARNNNTKRLRVSLTI